MCRHVCGRHVCGRGPSTADEHNGWMVADIHVLPHLACPFSSVEHTRGDEKEWHVAHEHQSIDFTCSRHVVTTARTTHVGHDRWRLKGVISRRVHMACPLSLCPPALMCARVGGRGCLKAGKPSVEPMQDVSFRPCFSRSQGSPRSCHTNRYYEQKQLCTGSLYSSNNLPLPSCAGARCQMRSKRNQQNKPLVRVQAVLRIARRN